MGENGLRSRSSKEMQSRSLINTIRIRKFKPQVIEIEPLLKKTYSPINLRNSKQKNVFLQ